MRVNHILTLGVIMAACGSAQAEKQPFDRYQPIVDRQMFGQLPPGFDPTKPPSEVTKSSQQELTKEQEQLKSAIHFSVINVTPDGETAVGFTDNSDPKAPVHYYLKVGEKRNGWEVQEADPQNATMTIAKGDIVVSLELGANSAKTAGATSAAKPATTGTAGRPGLLGGRQAAGIGTSPATGAPASSFGGGGFRAGMGAGSFRERRAQREAEKRARDEAAAAKAKADEEKREAEREARLQELQSIKDELKAQREAQERERQERERKEIEENERREREAQESTDKSDNAENDA